MFGEHNVHPDDFESAKGARLVMQEAADAYPEVREAIADPSTCRRDAPSVVGGNASIIPVHKGCALLTIEVRDGKRKYGLLGGKAEDGESLAMTAAREAFEESGRSLSDATRITISNLNSASAFKWCGKVEMHVAIAPVGREDVDAPSKFNKTRANRPGSKTEHVGIKWVEISELLNFEWRKKEMHWHASLMIVAVRDALRGHAGGGPLPETAARPSAGDKRPGSADGEDEEIEYEEGASDSGSWSGWSGSNHSGCEVRSEDESPDSDEDQFIDD